MIQGRCCKEKLDFSHSGGKVFGVIKPLMKFLNCLLRRKETFSVKNLSLDQLKFHITEEEIYKRQFTLLFSKGIFQS